MVVLPSRRFPGHVEESFQPVRQHDGQREEQDGGDEQELCESDVSSSHRWRRRRAVINRACLCVSGERVPGSKHALVQLFVDHDLFKGRK